MKCKTRNLPINNIILIIFTFSLSIKIIENVKISKINCTTEKLQENSKLRIIGGHNAKPYSAPFIVSIKRGPFGKHGCGGSIITSNTILTAAHCLKSDNYTDIYVVAGLYDRNIENEFTQKRHVRNYIKHENFKSKNTSGPYDLALLFLDEPFKFNDKISKIQLSNSLDKLNSKAILYGWGRTNPMGQERPNLLQTIITDLLTYEECRKLLINNKRLHWTNICTSRKGQGSIACHGDSGGPLVQINKMKNMNYNNNSITDDDDMENSDNDDVVQVGIVSWGFQICGWNSKPSIYTNVGYHLNWIWKNVEKYE